MSYFEATPIISLPAVATSSLVIPHPVIDTSYLIPHSLSPTPSSPTGSDTSSAYTSYSSSSPRLSDSEEPAVPMSQLNNVKKLLGMFPPPMTAKEFIERNSFKALDGHIKRPSNNFILFRKIAHDRKSQTSELSNYNEREFSKIIGKIWENLTSDEKIIYKKLGKEVAEMHKKLFPEYKYQPKRDKAAWKHFNPEISSSQKTRRKNKVKQQKHQETTPEVPTQQQQIIQDNSHLEYIPVEGLYFPYSDTENNYASNNNYIDMFNNTDVNWDTSNSINSIWGSL